MVNFADVLDTRVGDIPEPKNLPQGTYIWNVYKAPRISQAKSGDWDIVEFPLKVVAAEGDVDPDELEEFGDVAGTMNRISFMFPTDPEKKNDHARSMDQLKRFLTTTLRVEGDEDSTMKELLAGSANCQFLAIASWRQVGENTYVDVKNYAPLD